MTISTDITIIGAGPYGLSIAAHLRGLGLDFRIIGSPMHTWRTHMPKGMHLKSAGLSATLFDLEHKFTLKHYCEERGISYQDEGLPIPLELFTEYGMAFQKHFAPNLEETKLEWLTQCPEGYELRLENGVNFRTRKVVLAVGIDYFQYIPETLATLPKELFSHSGEHHDLQKFIGKEVIVIGSGSSAIDMAVLLHELGVKVRLIARGLALSFGHKEGYSRTLLDRIIAPMSGLGPGWLNLLCEDMPGLFHFLPDKTRIRVIKEFLGPSGGWFIKDRLEPVPVTLGYELKESTSSDGRAHLQFISKKDMMTQSFRADHVIAATGYRTDLSHLNFLDPDISSRLKLIGMAPRLSSNFESSLPGIYFAGPATATTFGPVMRFAVGSGFASKRISSHLARSVKTAAQNKAASESSRVADSINARY